MTKTAKATTLSEIVECLLDEIRLALRESMTGLTDEQVWAHPIPGRHCIGTIAEHLLLALDCYCGELQTGAMALSSISAN